MSMFRSKSVTSKVGDSDVEFFSLSFPVLFAMKSAVGPIAKVLANVFGSKKGFVSRMEQIAKDELGAPLRIVQEQAMTPDMAKLRAEQARATMQEAVEAIFADSNRLLIGRILMDSMRGICPRRPDTKQIEEFLADLDLGQVIEMISGVVKANAEVFGPLGQGWAKKANDLLRAQASSGSPTSSDSESAAPPVRPDLQLVPKD